MVKQYKKKPVIIEATQWLGDVESLMEIEKLSSTSKIIVDWKTNSLVIPTLEGNMIASLGDFIIKGIEGELYPCKPDIFFKTYDELVDFNG